MRNRLVVLVRGREVATAVGASALLGVLVTLAPAIDRAVLLVATMGLMLAFGGLVVWLVRGHREVEWTTSAGAAERVRGSDRRVTSLARSIDSSLAGDASAGTAVQATVRSVAHARLTQLGLPPTLTDGESRAALGPELAAYLSSPSAPQVSAGQLASFISTLEEH